MKYLMFWGHTPPADAEHFMMAAKARLFGDDEAVPGILAASHPGEAKALGRGVRDFDNEVWVRHRFDLVVEGNVAKFGQHPDLRDFLLGTERAADPEQWRGLNLLGFALMEARQRLAERAGPSC